MVLRCIGLTGLVKKVVGGVILYVKESLKSARDNTVNEVLFEDCIWCTVWVSGKKNSSGSVL